jgi:hypothetical protein
MSRKLVIQKVENTDTEMDDLTSYLDDTFTDTHTDDTYNRNVEYPKTVLNIEEIKKRLNGYIPLRSEEELKILKKLPLFKTWVKYIRKDTMEFKIGGLLSKVEYPEYIMLVGTQRRFTWSVQLKDNIIFVKDPRIVFEEQRRQEKETHVKEKLYELYMDGKLEIKK